MKEDILRKKIQEIISPGCTSYCKKVNPDVTCLSCDYKTNLMIKLFQTHNNYSAPLGKGLPRDIF